MSHQSSFYERRVATIADDLRRLADQVEREAKPSDKPGITGVPRYTNAAERVLHALTWGVANLNAHYIVSAAAEADEAER